MSCQSVLNESHRSAISRAICILHLFLLAFLSVTTAVADDAPVYRQVIKTFPNDSYYTKGLPATETVADGAGRVFAETTNTYTLKGENFCRFGLGC